MPRWPDKDEAKTVESDQGGQREKPLYRYVGVKGYFAPNDQLITTGTVFELDEEDGVNPDFEPMNRVAFEVLTKYYDKLEVFAKQKADKDGKAFAPMARRNGKFVMPSLKDRTVRITDKGEGLPMMGARKVTGGFNIPVSEAVPETSFQNVSRNAGIAPE